jgi:integrase/recombinase XerD
MKTREAIMKYLQELKLLSYSPVTIKTTRYNLLRFARFLETEKVVTIDRITGGIMEEYQEELAFTLTAKGGLLAIRSQEKQLNNAKCFTRFLYEKDYLVSDPGARIKLPKQPRRLPRTILDEGEIRKLFMACAMNSNQNVRDRITLELLYDTGIRCAEVANIKTHDLDVKNGYLHVRQGKGLKDRVVPLCSRVCGLIRDYLLVVRPVYAGGKDKGFLILNRSGEKMSNNGIYFTVKRCVKAAGIKKNISPHTFRHTCATHMLKNGAPIRHIQELLGHESLESTQIYTKVTINDLKEIHTKYHPGEKL